MNVQKGFSLVEGLLIILIISVVGFAGYYVWNENQDDEPEQTETVQQTTENRSTTLFHQSWSIHRQLA